MTTEQFFQTEIKLSEFKELLTDVSINLNDIVDSRKPIEQYNKLYLLLQYTKQLLDSVEQPK